MSLEAVPAQGNFLQSQERHHLLPGRGCHVWQPGSHKLPDYHHPFAFQDCLNAFIHFLKSLDYRIGLQKITTQKAQIQRDWLWTLNDFQKLLEDISSLRSAVGITSNLIIHLNKTLDGDKDLNSLRELTAEAEKELMIVEEQLQEAHVERVNPNLNCILVILPSRISPTGILMQRENVILEWIFLPHKPSKKLKTYVEKVSELFIKGKSRLRQLAGIDPAEITVQENVFDSSLNCT